MAWSRRPYCIDKNVPLLALDLLARIVPVRINARPLYPSSNQATTLESQMLHMIQELFGQTLREYRHMAIDTLAGFSYNWGQSP